MKWVDKNEKDGKLHHVNMIVFKGVVLSLKNLALLMLHNVDFRAKIITDKKSVTTILGMAYSITGPYNA